MSRTDAHAPLLVRLARRELLAVEDHDHRDDNCDLPLTEIGRPPAGSTGCSWQWRFDGTGICSCHFCHAWRRIDRRRVRHQTRGRLAAAVASWRGGDLDAFDR